MKDKKEEICRLGEQEFVGGEVEKVEDLVSLLFKIFTFACSAATIYQIFRLLKGFLNDGNDVIILQGGLYFLAILWLSGARFDSSLQKSLLIFLEKKIVVSKKEIAICCGIFVMFICLAFTVEYPSIFLGIILVFNDYNFYSYWHLIKVLYGDMGLSSVEKAKDQCSPAVYPFLFIRAKAAYDFIFGKWQIVRLIGLQLYGIMCAILFYINNTELKYLSKSDFVVCMFILQIFVFESWIYYMRLRFMLTKKISREYCGAKCCLLDR